MLESAGGPDFRIRRTEHFLIAYNTREDVLGDFVARVEATFRSVHRFLDGHGIPHLALDHRLEVVFFDAPADFRSFAERSSSDVRGAAGYYDPRTNVAAFYNALNAEQLEPVNRKIDELQRQLSDRARSSQTARASAAKELRLLTNSRDRLIEAINRMVVQHEVAHQVLFNAGLHARGADNPPWVVEGLACLFETPPSALGAGMGTINQYRLLSFREALAGVGRSKQARPEQYDAAVQEGRLVPLRRLIGDKTLLKPADAHADARYAQAWSLVCYLQHHRREDLGVYLAVLARRPSNRGYTPEQEVLLFEETFGPIDARFEMQWLNFVLKQRARPP